jgi:hypothetical protein
MTETEIYEALFKRHREIGAKIRELKKEEADTAKRMCRLRNKLMQQGIFVPTRSMVLSTKLEMQAKNAPPDKVPTRQERMDAYALALQDPRWISFRQKVLADHGNACDTCGIEGGVLHVHHLKYNGMPWEAKWDEVAVLCPMCHSKHHAHMRP